MSKGCLNCNERYPACHDSCDIYADFKKQREKIIEKQRQYMDGRGYDGCLAPKSRRLKGYDQTRFKY